MTDSRLKDMKSKTQTTEAKITIHDLTLDSDADETDVSAVSKSWSGNTLLRRKPDTVKCVSSTSDNQTGNADVKSAAAKSKRANRSKLSRTKKPKPDLSNIFGETDLNQMNDFSGGFTPYRTVVQKKLSRAKVSGTDTNTAPLRSSKGNHSNESSSDTKSERVSQGKQTRSKALTSTDDEHTADITAGCGTASETIDKEELNEDVPRIAEGKGSSVDPEVDKTCGLQEKMCTMCGETILTSDQGDHTKRCLHSRFNFKQDSSTTTSRVREKRRRDGNTVEDIDKYVFSQFCQHDITALSADSRTNHVNACIDGPPVTPATGGMPEDKVTCHVCHRDITDLNSHRRLQHVNFCFDWTEKEQQERDVAVKKARDSILDCPLCGKSLQTKATRLIHLKACSRALGVSLALLRDRIKQQEEEHQLKLAAGVLTPPMRVTRVKHSWRRRPRSTNTNRTAPVRHLDVDTQLALALSSSLHDQHVVPGLGASTGRSLQNQNEPDAFKVLMMPKVKSTTRGRKNKGPEQMPVLLLVSREDLRRHLAGRMELLFSRVSREISSTPPMKRAPTALIENNYQISQEATLWTLTKLSPDAGGCDVSNDVSGMRAFYVSQLMAHLTMATQPPTPEPAQVCEGRGVCGAGNLTLQTQSQSETTSKCLPTSNETLIATTQTAVYLAELATESGNATLNVTGLGMTLHDVSAQKPSDTSALELPPTVTSPSPHETTGFLLSGTTTDKHQQAFPGVMRLSDDLCAMVDNPLLSDLQIKVKDGSVWGHKFMFAARAQHVYEGLGSANMMTLSEYDVKTVRDVLAFIYTGVVGTVTPQVAKLASSWNLVDLVTHCNNRGISTEPGAPDGNTSQARLDGILKNIWGSDYEESDSDDGNNHLSDPNAEKDLVEACEYVLSQCVLSQRGRDKLSDSATSDEENGEELHTKGAFDQMNMTSMDVLTQLARMDQDGTETSDEELLPLHTEQMEKNMSKDEQHCEMDVEHARDDAMVQDWDCNDTDDKSLKIHEEDGLDVLRSGPVAVARNMPTTNKGDKRAVDSDSAEDHQSNGSNYSRSHVEVDEYSPQTIDSDGTRVERILSRISTPPNLQTAEIQVSLQTTNSDSHDGHRTEIPKISRVLDRVIVRSDEAGSGDIGNDNKNCTTDGATTQELVTPSATVPRVPSESHTPVTMHELSDPEHFSDPATPDLFSGSPQTPCLIDGFEGLAMNKTATSPGSERDLFEISSNSLGDEPRGRGMTQSPVFGSVMQANRLRVAKKLNAVFSTADDDKSDDKHSDGLIETQLNRTAPTTNKRKRSLSDSASEKAEIIPKPEKKACAEYVADGSIGVPTYEQIKPSELDETMRSHTPTRDANSDEVNARVPELHESYVTSSDSDLDTAPIYLTQGEDDFNDVVVDHTAEEIILGSPSRSPSCRVSYEGDDGLTRHQMSPSPYSFTQGDAPVPDVWSDFDDAGYTEDLLMPVTQPCEAADNTHCVSQEVQPSPPLPRNTPNPVPDYDPPTDMETDVSLMEDDSTLSKQAYTLNTPKPPKPTRRKRAGPPVPPSPFTPIADYNNMSTPEIMKACQNYGVRPMPKKRMIQMLTGVYHDLHQYETDSEFEQSFDVGGPSRGAVPTGGTSSSATRTWPTQTGRDDAGRQWEDDLTPSWYSTNPVELSDDDLPEESFLGTPCSQTSSTSSPEKGAKDKASQKEIKVKKLRTYILSNRELYMKILHYEPLEFEELRAQLKSMDLKVSSGILMDFLDEQNIQFTLRKRKEDKAEKRAARRGKQDRAGSSPRRRGRGRGRSRGKRAAAASQVGGDQ